MYSVSTNDVSIITQYDASGGGFSIDVSGATLLQKGLAWKVGVDETPTLNDSYNVYPDTSTGDFSLGIINLNPSTHYTVRAFIETIQRTPNIYYFGLSLADQSTLIVDDGYIYGIDVCIGLFSGEVKYTPWTANPSTLIISNGLIIGVDTSQNDTGWAGSVQYLGWYGAASFNVVQGRIGSNYTEITYGDKKEFDSLDVFVPPALTGRCIDCIHIARDSSGNLEPADASGNFICDAFLPGLSTPEYIPWYVANGSTFHDFVISGQNASVVWEQFDAKSFEAQSYYPYYDKRYYHTINAEGAGYDLIGGWYTLDPSNEYGLAVEEVSLQGARLEPGDNISFDVSYGPGDLFPSNIRINATAGGSCVSSDASIVILRAKDAQIDASIIRIDTSINNTIDGSTIFQPLLQYGTKTGTTAGSAGQWSFDASYFYICTSTNIWRRILTSAF